MRKLPLILAIFALTACGVETATTAGTAAALKKQEIEQGKKTMQQMQQNINQTMEQAQQRANQAGDAAK